MRERMVDHVLDEALRVAGADGSDRGVRDRVVADLRRRHDEDHRAYHDRRHLGEMVAEVRRLSRADRAGDAGSVPASVLLAILHHDAVYDPTAGDNEARSARLARANLAALGLDPGLVDEVARLVLVTRGHRVDRGDRSGALLVDADLWILSSPTDRYDQYVAAVRREYGHLDEAAWRHGRIAVVEALDTHLATTGYLVGPDRDRRRRTRAARENLDRERRDLVDRPEPPATSTPPELGHPGGTTPG